MPLLEEEVLGVSWRLAACTWPLMLFCDITKAVEAGEARETWLGGVADDIEFCDSGDDCCWGLWRGDMLLIYCIISSLLSCNSTLAISSHFNLLPPPDLCFPRFCCCCFGHRARPS